MALMCPCCSAPSRFPAPRSSRSSAAILKPEPSSLNSFKAASRRRATSDKRASPSTRGLDGVVEEVARPAAPELLLDGGADELVARRGHHRLDRQPVGRGGL